MSETQMGPHQGQAKPGQMTAVMRAMTAPTGPKVLRIGLVQSGRVIEERIIKQRTSVTVGSGEKAMFVIPAPNMPPQFKLFELLGNEYYLNFIDGMMGRIALASGITDIASLKGQAKKIGNVYQVKLTEEARGKVVVGDTTFLFQFVAPPPVQPRPQLPLAVKGGLASQIDWTLTIIAAFSFMLHFGMVGAMYSDWMDPIVSDDLAMRGLIDQIKNIPPPPVEDKPTNEKADKPAEKAPTKAPEKKSAGSNAPAPKPGAVSEARASALAKEAEEMRVGLLAAFGGASAVQGALNRSEIPPADLSGIAGSAAGVTNTGSTLNVGGGGPMTGHIGGAGLANLGQTGATGQSGAGKEAAVAGPRGDAMPSVSSMTVPVNGAERVIAGLRARFRSCYQKGLSQDPSMQGSATFAVKIAPNGEVQSSDAVSNTGLSSEVVSCIARVLRNANFDPPGGSGSTLQVPVKFVQQSK